MEIFSYTEKMITEIISKHDKETLKTIERYCEENNIFPNIIEKEKLDLVLKLGIDDYNKHKFWVDLCDNREVINGKIKFNGMIYFISDIWCIDKSNKPLSIKFNKLYIITVLFDEIGRASCRERV